MGRKERKKGISVNKIIIKSALESGKLEMSISAVILSALASGETKHQEIYKPQQK